MDLNKTIKHWLPIFLLLFTCSFVLSSPAFAHTNNSEGYSSIEVKEETLTYELKVDLTEFGHAMNKDLDPSQAIDTTAVQQYINSHIKLFADGARIEGRVSKTDIATINERPFAVVDLTYKLDQKPEKLVLEYNMFLDDSDPSHANFATIKMDGEQREQVLTFEKRELEIGEGTALQTSKQFLSLGLEHIFTGYDHILFVISLLIGAKTVRHIFSLITAFTIAHSITLALATLQIVQFPSKWVEMAIALSIIYVALVNIFDRDSKQQPWIAFSFGLIHGFGFAGILSEMRLDVNHMATTLLSFNIGIELGQLLIVLIAYPIILFIKKIRAFKWVIPGTSMGILAFGLLWFFQRVF
ncbi:HupE/UreJ family protein [Bacillus sp. 37MA]|uniref:HupE/UreJ family protein n=1 Tax=Bacillus sp. 37MA TaxID=1132442 RepID=UPI0003639DB9|nr:HupE/UreJ family protein [Bacillus sp. 37MA]